MQTRTKARTAAANAAEDAAERTAKAWDVLREAWCWLLRNGILGGFLYPKHLCMLVQISKGLFAEQILEPWEDGAAMDMAFKRFAQSSTDAVKIKCMFDASKIDRHRVLLVLLKAPGGSELAMVQLRHNGDTCLHIAVENNHLLVVQALLNVRGGELVYSVNREQCTALHIASQETGRFDDTRGWQPVVDCLLRVGGSKLAMMRDKKEMTCLQNVISLPVLCDKCVDNKDIENMALVMIQKGGGTELVMAENKSSGKNCLMLAVDSCWSAQLVKILLSYGEAKLLKTEDEDEDSCLFYALSIGSSAVALALFKAGGPDLARMVTRQGENILHAIVHSGCVKTMQKFLQQLSKMDINLFEQADNEGNTCLLLAIKEGDQHMVSFLARWGGYNYYVSAINSLTKDDRDRLQPCYPMFFVHETNSMTELFGDQIFQAKCDPLCDSCCLIDGDDAAI